MNEQMNEQMNEFNPSQSLQKVNVLTLFPELVEPYFKAGIIGRAIDRDLLKLECLNFRAFATGRHQAVDDVPFGGGAGMVIQAEPVAQALDSLASTESLGRVILTTPGGPRFTQRDAERLSKESHLTFICGRYEGIDARLNIEYVNEEFSIGDYVLSGGELAAMVMIDAIARLRPGALNNADSAKYESHSLGSHQLLESPHYTRPANWRGHEVPQVLLSGHHARIQAWRRQESIKRTAQVRPELLQYTKLTPEEQMLVQQLSGEENDHELA